MKAIRTIQKTTDGQLFIQLPDDFKNVELEIIILPLQEEHAQSLPSTLSYPIINARPGEPEKLRRLKQFKEVISGNFEVNENEWYEQ